VIFFNINLSFVSLRDAEPHGEPMTIALWTSTKGRGRVVGIGEHGVRESKIPANCGRRLWMTSYMTPVECSACVCACYW